MYSMEFCSVIKKHDIMSFAGKWMEMEIIMFSEITSPTKTNSAYFLSFVQVRGKTKTKTRS
jgi:hypothetical protein